MAIFYVYSSFEKHTARRFYLQFQITNLATRRVVNAENAFYAVFSINLIVRATTMINAAP